MKIPTGIFSVGLAVVALYAVNLWLRLGDPEVMAIAKHVIRRNDQDGLGEFLDQLVATHEVEPVNDADDALT